MGEHDLSAGGDVMTRVRGCAQDALAAYGAHPAAAVELINVSENATFLVTDPDTGPAPKAALRCGIANSLASGANAPVMGLAPARKEAAPCPFWPHAYA